MKHYGDITKINGAEVPIVDVICGGSPCQDLSVAGLRKGLQHSALGDGETTRSGLFMDQIRIVKEQRDECLRQLRMQGSDEYIRPRYMVWENVAGAFSSNKGEDFRVVLEETAKVAEKDAVIPGLEKGQKWSNAGLILGDGWSIAWRLHDSQFWGVPQRRKRLCVLADFNGHTAGEILFELQRKAVIGNTEQVITDIGNQPQPQVSTVCESVQRDSEQSGQKGQGTSADAPGSTNSAISFQERAGKPGGGKGLLIQNEKTGALATHPQSVCHEPILLESNQNHATVQTNGVSTALPASMGMGGGYTPMIAYGLDRASFNQGKNAQFDFSVDEEIAPTLVNRGPGGVLTP